jgi:hypothetical protein
MERFAKEIIPRVRERQSATVNRSAALTGEH